MTTDVSKDRIRTLVSRLLQKLDVKDKPDTYVDLLAQNISSFTMTKISVSTARRKLFDRTNNPELFNETYDRLAQLGCVLLCSSPLLVAVLTPHMHISSLREFDRYMMMSSKILEDKTLVKLLSSAGAGALAKSQARTSARFPLGTVCSNSAPLITFLSRQCWTARPPPA